MRKTFVLLILSIPINLFSQVENVYRVFYKPDKHYTIKNELYSATKMSLEGDKGMIDDINRQSIYPLTLYIATSSEISLSTGPATMEDIIPIKISFDRELTKTTFNNKTTIQKNPLKGISIEGIYENKNNFTLMPGSIDDFDESKKQNILKSIEISKNQILFPETPLKIGDQFIQKFPMEIPVPGLKTIQCTISTIFTLTDILNNVAHFTINQDIIQDTDKINPSIELKGAGSGSVDYDIKDNFLTNRTINSAISIRFKSEKVDVIMDFNNSIDQQIMIE
jgi:hypothetical protein